MKKRSETGTFMDVLHRQSGDANPPPGTISHGVAAEELADASDVKGRLRGKRILLAEDEALISLALQGELMQCGVAEVVIVTTLSEAIDATEAEAERFDGAILDIDLHGQDVYPVADQLHQRETPFLFHTGHGAREGLDDSYPGVPVCGKPLNIEMILRVLARLMGPGVS